MTAQDLKNSILQQAIQGKLLPQNPDDEPASELLKKISAQRQKLIAEGKIKKEKPLPPIKAEEIPFDIPDSWQWVRLGEIGETNIGLTYSPNDISTDGVVVLRSGNIQNGKIDYRLFLSCIQVNNCNIEVYPKFTRQIKNFLLVKVYKKFGE